MLCCWVHLGVSYPREPVNDLQVPEASITFGESAQALMDLHGHLGDVSTVLETWVWVMAIFPNPR